MPGDGNTDNLAVSATALLDSNGSATTVNFSISPVGGDTEASNAIEPAALYDDYIFNNSAGNQVGAAGSPFTISGLQGPTADRPRHGCRHHRHRRSEPERHSRNL
jgi:hypothetical protein